MSSTAAAIETRFARDIEQVPAGRSDDDRSRLPRTIQDANFVESRLHSLRTRNAAAYKGIAALVLANGARDWMEDKALDKVQYVDLAVDIHHIFPQDWCDDTASTTSTERASSTRPPSRASTNRTIGGVAPSNYLATIEKTAQIGSPQPR